MERQDLSSDELRAALARADKHLRLPWGLMFVATAVVAFATNRGLDAADFSNPTHVLIVAAAVWMWAWTFFGLSLLQSRQLAANARMLRALELLDERLGSARPDA